MRIVWRDSNAPAQYKTIKYRQHFLQGTPQGWVTTVPGDNNLYANHYCAQNAVDKHYGDYGQHGSAKRKKYGIQIVGKKDGETA